MKKNPSPEIRDSSLAASRRPAEAGEQKLRWFKVCRQIELKTGQAKSITLLARPYAVFNVNGELFGLDAACRHAKANLAAGKLDGKIVECFMHGWRYDVTTGECLTMDYGRVSTHPVKTEDGFVWIGIDWPTPEVHDDAE